LSSPGVAADMRAVRFETDGSIELINLPIPTLGPEDVLVQVLAAGVCRTDLHTRAAVKEGKRPPVVPGHEIAGRVTKLGSDVYMINAGDLVAVHYEQPCGACRHCRKKRTNLCQEGHSLGFDVPGGYAEYVAVKQSTVLPLPQDYDPSVAAPLGCSGTTAYHALVAVADTTEDELVVVLGAGGVGLSAVQVAKAQGARVIAVDVRPEAQKAALDAGADTALAPGQATEIRDADVVVDFVSTAQTLGLARGILGVGGRVVVVASGTEPISLSAADIMEGGRAYLGSYSSTMADLARAVALAENGKLTPVVTRRASLEEAADVLHDLEAGKIVGRAVLLPTGA
jgi:alcohol dehydrogenase, propanol-preferring